MFQLQKLNDAQAIDIPGSLTLQWHKNILPQQWTLLTLQQLNNDTDANASTFLAHPALDLITEWDWWLGETLIVYIMFEIHSVINSTIVAVIDYFYAVYFKWPIFLLE